MQMWQSANGIDAPAVRLWTVRSPTSVDGRWRVRLPVDEECTVLAYQYPRTNYLEPFVKWLVSTSIAYNIIYNLSYV